MVEPLSVIAGAVTTVIVPKALEKIGEKMGEAALEKSGAAIKAIRETVQAKLQAIGTAGLLSRAEEKPTESNVQMLQAEIMSQMESDRAFASRLQELVNQLQSQAPSLQVILDGLRIKGKVELGNVKQVSEGQGCARQLMGRDWQIDGDVKIDDITQENLGGK